MSRSSLMMKVRYHMLENRKACVPGYEDSSGGHTPFDFGWFKLRVHPPDGSTFDELYEPYDREAMITQVQDDLLREVGSHVFRRVIGNLLDQAKEHCDARHGDIREEFKKQ